MTIPLFPEKIRTVKNSLPGYLTGSHSRVDSTLSAHWSEYFGVTSEPISQEKSDALELAASIDSGISALRPFIAQGTFEHGSLSLSADLLIAASNDVKDLVSSLEQPLCPSSNFVTCALEQVSEPGLLASLQLIVQKSNRLVSILVGSYERPISTATGAVCRFDSELPSGYIHLQPAGVEQKPRIRELLISSGSQTDSLHLQFALRASRWRKQTDKFSIVKKKINHPDYQAIIDMGERALPLILQELQSNGGHWFYALSAITGEDVIPPELAGNVKEMRNCWLEWGRRRGLISS